MLCCETKKNASFFLFKKNQSNKNQIAIGVPNNSKTKIESNQLQF